MARPAIATERLSELPDGRIAYGLRHPWSDGTTRVVFEAVFSADVLRCHRCGGRREVLTFLTDGAVVRAILLGSA